MLMSANAQDSNVSHSGRAPRILVPLDGSDLAAQALPLAETIAAQLGAELELVSVLPPVVLPYVGGEPYVPGEVYLKLDTDRTLDAQRYLDTTAADTRQRYARVATHLERGDPASCLLDAAQDLGVDLIIMTTHGRTGLARFTLGSVADRVVRGGAAPVLLLNSYPTTAHGKDLSRALIPLDGSPVAESLLFSIVPLLAGPVLRTITLLRVSDPRDGEAGRQAVEDYLNGVRLRLVDHVGDRNCAVSILVRSNKNPAASIVEITQDGECDLVLMSTHGEAGIGRWAFGGIADRVLRDSKTPLLFVHPPRK